MSQSPGFDPNEADNQSVTPLPSTGEITNTGIPVPPPPPTNVRVNFPQRKPYVSYSLLIITVLAYGLQVLTEIIFDIDMMAAVGMKVNSAIMEGQLWRLVTPIFLHGSLLHIGFNMYALHILGPQLERFFGHWEFFLLYMVSGFGGVVFSFILTENPSLGASTAIFGLLGAQGVFAYNNQRVFGLQARKALRSIVNIAVINFIIGLSPGIDNWAHMGGLIGGLVITYYGGPVFTLTGSLPNLEATNEKTSEQFIIATGITLLFFALLAAAIIFLPISLI
ncbi:MAG: rhomboid family intramembrane serine protease [Chloroflexi bacterium]|nr:rhomboid family intramembrane serine protease [Chloroflexota bacterium]MBT3670207.1 rhomboid family intramembrane serine protease [Chloroflexota bacterium]MBT4002127.1 rhomboid family intramembrane serine protease [Chloroflexota bacterium]MBT4306119.1 rhomboid family intramembrane serine protease [Chloroflexota bacterium]MBT4534499.1 rhomboid family intramembrane serine protease [Chloroflexota bacterium]